MSDIPDKPIKRKLKPAKKKSEQRKAPPSIDDASPEKLAAALEHLEFERAAWIAAKVEAGEAVLIQAIQMEGEDEKAAQERALAQHPPLDGKAPIFDVVRIDTGVARDPGGMKPAPAYVPSGDPDEYHPPAVARHEEYISRGAKCPKRVSVAHYDGGVVEGWFTIADGFVQLCDVMGAPHSE